MHHPLCLAMNNFLGVYLSDYQLGILGFAIGGKRQDLGLVMGPNVGPESGV